MTPESEQPNNKIYEEYSNNEVRPIPLSKIKQELLIENKRCRVVGESKKPKKNFTPISKIVRKSGLPIANCEVREFAAFFAYARISVVMVEGKGRRGSTFLIPNHYSAKAEDYINRHKRFFMTYFGFSQIKQSS